ncbi:uncharacterized protein [Montipora capricornis]|uniref:uncharacterized protein n=1 Tax=Montipora capricornis TaxID=246305 RepID=UPI0035F16E96
MPADDDSFRSKPALAEASRSAVKALVDESIANLSDNLTEVIESRLGAFATKFSAQNSSTVTNAVKKARFDRYICKRKGNQQQLDHVHDVLETFDDATDTLKAGAHERVKRSLEEGTKLVSKRIKAIKLADKSEFGWLTVNEYLSDELASDSDDEKRMYRSEKRAERKVNEKLKQKRSRPQRRASSSYRTTSSYSSRKERSDDRFEPRPRRLGPCFKLSIPLLSLLSLALFFYFGYGRSYARRPCPVCSMYSVVPCAIWS